MHLLSPSLFVFAPLLLTTTVTSLPLPKRDLIPVGLEPHMPNTKDGVLWQIYSYAESLHEFPPKAKAKRSTTSMSPILEPYIPIAAEYPSSEPSGPSRSSPDNAAPPLQPIQSLPSPSSSRRAYPANGVFSHAHEHTIPRPWGPGPDIPKKEKRADESA